MCLLLKMKICVQLWIIIASGKESDTFDLYDAVVH